MLDRTNLHAYQNKAIDFIKHKRKCALFLDMGLGKTVITLTAISDMIDQKKIGRVLIIAPLRVVTSVWCREYLNWNHLKHLHIRSLLGTPEKRREKLGNLTTISVINVELVAWLIDQKKWYWDAVVIDESTMFKSHNTARFMQLKRTLKFLNIVILLTGTPTTNRLLDLWSQIYLIDQGERLTKYITHYRDLYFKQVSHLSYSYRPLRGADRKISSLISDICLSMSAEDYQPLPKIIYINEFATLPNNAKQVYKELKKDFVTRLANNTTIVNAGAGLTKLLQVCNGSIYDHTKKAHHLHASKIDLLKELMDNNPNDNFLVAYSFISDKDRLKKEFPRAVVLDKNPSTVDSWNAGKIKMLIAHPASAGHGLNLQYGGAVVVWFGVTWSLELYQQFNARLHRQGQIRPVRVVHIITRGTMESAVLQALREKKNFLDIILRSTKERNKNV